MKGLFFCGSVKEVRLEGERCGGIGKHRHGGAVEWLRERDTVRYSNGRRCGRSHPCWVVVEPEERHAPCVRGEHQH